MGDAVVCIALGSQPQQMKQFVTWPGESSNVKASIYQFADSYIGNDALPSSFLGYEGEHVQLVSTHLQRVLYIQLMATFFFRRSMFSSALCSTCFNSLFIHFQLGLL